MQKKQKVFIYSIHPKKKCGKERMEKILLIHGENAQVEFGRMPAIEGPAQFVLMRHMVIINEKVEEGYTCYLEIDKKLARKIVEKGISFGVIEKPETVGTGKKISITYYDATVPPQLSQRVLASFIKKSMPESGEFINCNGRGAGRRR